MVSRVVPRLPLEKILDRACAAKSRLAGLDRTGMELSAASERIKSQSRNHSRLLLSALARPFPFSIN